MSWVKGKKHTPEAKAKMSAAKTGNTNALGHKPTPETRAKMSAAKKGKKYTPEHCAKMSEALKGRKFSPEHCAKISAAQLGTTRTRGYKHTAEARAKIGAAGKGRKHTAETRIKMRESHLQRIEQSLAEGGQLAPFYNPRACEWFTQFDAAHQTEGQHAMNGGEARVAGYFLDYINHDLKLIIEWDEEAHYTDGELHIRDVRRQAEIQEQHLGYQFIRIRESEGIPNPMRMEVLRWTR